LDSNEILEDSKDSTAGGRKLKDMGKLMRLLYRDYKGLIKIIFKNWYWKVE
jgi:hypothetical protein